MNSPPPFPFRYCDIPLTLRIANHILCQGWIHLTSISTCLILLSPCLQLYTTSPFPYQIDFSVCKNISHHSASSLARKSACLPEVIPGKAWSPGWGSPWPSSAGLSPVSPHPPCGVDPIVGILLLKWSHSCFTEAQQSACFCLTSLLCIIALGCCVKEVIHKHSQIPETDSPVLQVLLTFSRWQFASILEIFEHVLDADY